MDVGMLHINILRTCTVTGRGYTSHDPSAEIPHLCGDDDIR